MKHKKLATVAAMTVAGVAVLTGCSTDADTASYNLSKDADQFKIERNIVFYNGITGEIMSEITGFCSLLEDGKQLEVTCKVGENQYTKDYLRLSDNVSYMALQTEATDVSLYHRKVLIKPQNVIPEFSVEVGKQ